MKRYLIASSELRDWITHLPPAVKKKIRSGLEEILENPESGKPLKEELLGLRSYRVGPIRIIYKMSAPGIELILIGPRKSVYQKAILILKQLSKT